ncbi:HD-GYP domain-containing protein [Alginatibacterium sediminis]|uniref:HD-GYP domain-containing protein n=1 Tax=Alginatibacterium sediminis TaxID=2164068 RepID=A0A420E9K7_9ALTE|nr:HD-GYP domain-containing protein [Alginatibacterium sediminis]RKF15812.1 HD-GYP domain-containing protein [Alginatibacterium sediminis]
MPVTPTHSTEVKPRFQEFAVSQLQIGMYVDSILSQSGKAELKQSGRIGKAEHIEILRKKGVLTVKVDWQRSKVEQPKDAEEKSPESKVKNVAAAKRMFQEAKSLQSKYFQQLRQGEPIDLQEMEEIASGLVDALGEFSEALMVLSKLRAKDKYLLEHSLNVGMLLAYFGRYLGMERDVQSQLVMGGMLHDIGKINTPDAILHKPGRLTEAEFVVMREHVVHSRLILEKQEGISQIMMDVAANHHEHIDGNGYPRHLKEDQLSIYSRMATLVDVYDALTADRVYKSGMPPTKAFGILLKGSGSQFETGLLEKFIRCMGVYPIGTLVQLKSGRLGFVTNRHASKPMRPTLRLVYNAKTSMHIEVVDLDLSKTPHDEIEAAVSARDFGLDIQNYVQ